MNPEDIAKEVHALANAVAEVHRRLSQFWIMDSNRSVGIVAEGEDEEHSLCLMVRINRVLSYLLALVEPTYGVGFFDKIQTIRLVKEDGEFVANVVWNSNPSDGQKFLVQKAWECSIGMPTVPLFHHFDGKKFQ